MNYSHAKVQDQWSVGSEERVETNGRPDRQTDRSDCITYLAKAVCNENNDTQYLYSLSTLVKKIEIWWCSRFPLKLHIVADNTLLRKKTSNKRYHKFHGAKQNCTYTAAYQMTSLLCKWQQTNKYFHFVCNS